MAFPIVARVKIRFRQSDTGLTPIFTRFQRFDTLQPILPLPAILEIGGGDYFFEWVWVAANDPDIDYQIDGGVSIPTPEARYVDGILTVRDYVVATSGSGTGGGSAWTVG